MTKVSLKNTKQEILTEYEKNLSELKTLRQQKYDPAAEKVTAAKAEVTVKALETAESTDDLTSKMNGIVEAVKKAAEDALSNLDAVSSEVKTIEEAILYKKAELRELVEIEVSVDSLAALINTQQEIKKKHDEENKATLEIYQEQLAQVKLEIKEASENHAKLLKELHEERKIQERKAQEEFDYNFERQKRFKLDTMHDEIAAMTKEADAREKELDERQADIKKREAAIDELQQQIESIKESNAAETSKAVAIAVNSVKKDHELALAKQQAELDSVIAILTNKVQMLEEALSTERKAHEQTASKLETAYNSVERVATASVEGARTEETVNRLLSTMGESGKK